MEPCALFSLNVGTNVNEADITLNVAKSYLTGSKGPG